MAEVILDHVYKSFEKTEVIKDVSLHVRDREFVVLVGPSGCGKSTVLRMIAGLESATQGTLNIGGRVVNNVAPKDRDIAMVFQNYALYPHMSVYDNMAFGLKMRKFPKPEIDKRVREAAQILDLAHLLDRKPKQLSGGQRQRVALGRAIVRDPAVFLMDEPLSNLDAKLRVQMRSEIAKLHKRLNATTIYVTHDQVEAMTMGDRIVILNKGVIQQVDSPLKVYLEPANLFVAGFIGQMNFLKGSLEGSAFVLSDGTRIPLTDSLQQKTQGHKEVILGLRPEHFAVEGEGVPLTVTPERIELLGSDKMIHAPLAGQELIAKLPPDAPAEVGQPLNLILDLHAASLFDSASEQRL